MSLEIGDARIAAQFDPKQMEEERISAVQYLRFPIPEAAHALLADPSVPAQLRIDHPRYEAAAFLSPATRASLSRDLDGGAGPLLDTASIPAPPEPEVIRELGRVRALRPVRSRGPGHVVLESVVGASFDDAPAELVAELMALAQEFAREIEAAHGGCVLVMDASGPLRCHLHAPVTGAGGS